LTTPLRYASFHTHTLQLYATREMKLRALGFCGADDSVSPLHLAVICNSYPFVEFGVLFRPDREGQPRYATADWVGRLAAAARKSDGRMKLAAHLCGSRVKEVLDGDDAFVSTLPGLGFKRVQINATAVNGVDTSSLATSISAVAALMARHPELEFILQKNDETEPLWSGLLNGEGVCFGDAGRLPRNVTMLVDDSKGTGVLASSWPPPPEGYNIGYAGGIGPANVRNVLKDVSNASRDRDVWIDMESSLRSIKDGRDDVFDLDKCFQCIEAVCEMGIYDHPDFL